jgi:arsenate reductase
VLANLLFDLSAVTASRHDRDQSHLWLGEAVAMVGLVLLIFSLVRTRRATLAPPAAAYWFTSFANPAVTIGRAFSDTFADRRRNGAGLAPLQDDRPVTTPARHPRGRRS